MASLARSALAPWAPLAVVNSQTPEFEGAELGFSEEPIPTRLRLTSRCGG
jgi:hypothetical protein